MASVWAHERQHTGQTMSQVIAAFRERFNKAPPRRATLLDWEKRAFALGSVKDRPWSGRKTTLLETCAAVAASIERSPMKSTRKRSSELGVPRSTMQDHMKKDLNVRPYRPTFVNVGYYQGYSGCASLQQQRRFAQSCGRRLSHSYSKNAPTYVTEDMEAHPFVCPASRCTYGSTGHVTKEYVSDSNQFKIYIESEVRIFWVYGDFSATL